MTIEALSYNLRSKSLLLMVSFLIGIVLTGGRFAQ